MAGIIDADTHISEGEAMWAMMDKDMYQRRPVLVKCSDDTLYGPRNAFWLIDGNIFPKPNGKGSFRLITPAASKDKGRWTIPTSTRSIRRRATPSCRF